MGVLILGYALVSIALDKLFQYCKNGNLLALRNIFVMWWLSDHDYKWLQVITKWLINE